MREKEGRNWKEEGNIFVQSKKYKHIAMNEKLDEMANIIQMIMGEMQELREIRTYLKK